MIQKESSYGFVPVLKLQSHCRGLLCLLFPSVLCFIGETIHFASKKQVQLPLRQSSQDVITFGATMRAYEEAAEWPKALALLGELKKDLKANTVLGRL